MSLFTPIFAICEFICDNPLRFNKVHSLVFILEWLQIIFVSIIPHAALLTSFENADYNFPLLKNFRWIYLSDFWSGKPEIANVLVFILGALVFFTAYLSIVVGRNISPFTKHSFSTRSIQFLLWLISRPLYIPFSLLFLSQIRSIDGVNLHFPDSELSFSPVLVVACLAFVVLSLCAFFHHLFVTSDDILLKKWFSTSSSFPFVLLYFHKLMVVMLYFLMFNRYYIEARLFLGILSFYTSIRIWLKLPFFYFIPNGAVLVFSFTSFTTALFGFAHSVTLNWSFSLYLPLIGFSLGFITSIIFALLLYKRFVYFVQKEIPREFLDTEEPPIEPENLHLNRIKRARAMSDASSVSPLNESALLSTVEFDAPFEVELKSRFLLYRPWRFWRQEFDSISDARAKSFDACEALFEYGCDVFGAVPELIIPYCRFVLYRRLDTKYVLLQLHAVTSTPAFEGFYTKFLTFTLHTRARRMNANVNNDEDGDDNQSHHGSMDSLDSAGGHSVAGSSLASFNSTGGSWSTRAHRQHLLCLKNYALFWLGMMPRSFAITKMSSFTYEATIAQRSALRMYNRVISSEVKAIGSGENLSVESSNTLKLYGAFLSEVCHEDSLSEQAFLIASVEERDADFDEFDDEEPVGRVSFSREAKMKLSSSAVTDILLTPEQLEVKRSQAAQRLTKATINTVDKIWSDNSDTLFRRHPLIIPHCFNIRNADRKYQYLPRNSGKFLLVCLPLLMSFFLLYLGYFWVNSSVNRGYNSEQFNLLVSRANYSSNLVPLAAELMNSIKNDESREVILNLSNSLYSFMISMLSIQSQLVQNSRLGNSGLSIAVLAIRNSWSSLTRPTLRPESELDLIADVSSSILIVSKRIAQHFDTQSFSFSDDVIFSALFPSEYSDSISLLSSSSSSTLSLATVPVLEDILFNGELLSDTLVTIMHVELRALEDFLKTWRLFFIISAIILFIVGIYFTFEYIFQGKNAVNNARNEILHTLANEMPSVIAEVLASRYKQALMNLPGGKSVAMELSRSHDETVDTSVREQVPAPQMGRTSIDNLKMSELEEGSTNESSSYLGPAIIDLMEHWAGSPSSGPEFGTDLSKLPSHLSETLKITELSLLNPIQIKKTRRCLIFFAVLLAVPVFLILLPLIYSLLFELSVSSSIGPNVVDYGADPFSRIGFPHPVALPSGYSNSLGKSFFDFGRPPLNVLVSRFTSLYEHSFVSSFINNLIINSQSFVISCSSNPPNSTTELFPHLLLPLYTDLSTLLTRVSRTVSLAGTHLVLDSTARSYPMAMERVLPPFIATHHVSRIASRLVLSTVDDDVISTSFDLNIGGFSNIFKILDENIWDLSSEPDPFSNRDLVNYPERLLYSTKEADLEKSIEVKKQLAVSLVSDNKVRDSFNIIDENLREGFNLLKFSSELLSDSICSSFSSKILTLRIFLFILSIAILFALFYVSRNIYLASLLIVGPSCQHVAQQKILSKQKLIRKLLNSCLFIVFLISFGALFYALFISLKSDTSCIYSQNSEIFDQILSLSEVSNDLNHEISTLIFNTRLYITRPSQIVLLNKITSRANVILELIQEMENLVDNIYTKFSGSEVSPLLSHISDRLSIIFDGLKISSKYLYHSHLISTYLHTLSTSPSSTNHFAGLSLTYDYSTDEFESFLISFNHFEFPYPLSDFNTDTSLTEADQSNLIDNVIKGRGVANIYNIFSAELTTFSKVLSNILEPVSQNFHSHISNISLKILISVLVAVIPPVLLLFLLSLYIYPDTYVKPAVQMWRFAVFIKSFKSIKVLSFGLLFIVVCSFLTLSIVLFGQHSPAYSHSTLVYSLSNLIVEVNNLHSNSILYLSSSSSSLLFSLAQSKQRAVSFYETICTGGTVDLLTVEGFLDYNYGYYSGFMKNLDSIFHDYLDAISNLATLSDSKVITNLNHELISLLSELSYNIDDVYKLIISNSSTRTLSVFVTICFILLALFTIASKLIVKVVHQEHRFNMLLVNVVPPQVYSQVPSLSLLVHILTSNS
ncbi:hypothetical protein RCL1_003293 [Eukaryota sp. TZLM3-RCL]